MRTTGQTVTTAITASTGCNTVLAPWRGADLDPYEALELGRARRAIKSPIKAPEGGWAGPEPATPARKKKPKTPRGPARPRGRSPEALARTQAVRDLAAQGLHAREIAKALGVSGTTVYEQAKKHGITLQRLGTGGRTAGWDVEEAVRLAGQGMTNRAIAEAVGADAATVRRSLKRRGVVPQAGSRDAATSRRELLQEHDVHLPDLRVWAAATGRYCPRTGYPPLDLIREYVAQDVAA